ncbi:MULTISPECIES: prolipoprotein diacylglyceryl transferase [unclassified Chelatococcus]|uniref:prolipoprotein diacylglyceryl transferase n=1 Tax=unclassified Chelatococcus TaxID=2638111 RepID=UPI001BCBA0CA|nr:MULTISPECIES: prolipoprotein diacylglyceryl transferase [unclassified Chelatococcus]CAH1665073.1 Phosphatidylglycerol--prolipoprotein diacylglyceryl transferase [Hyphomicrobiales bacterium]MBS7737669.1 prolipoprotein diacylglyceryl transferase [Chelatococcus sp. HY11]MBX3544197.1 prolipoprotein diacylglyceryl transferase [Chelatococcus sp.]MCO5079481.1 prolipoprotein diacylglyceryl transferase [Chelatococcus sp.]CAH1681531.1 Phosphatidylglycerol--prolipoprotein diacylglyceryl transferase [H
MTFAINFPVIDPVIFAIGPFAIRWYALAYVVGLIGGWLLMRRLVDISSLWGAIRRPSRNDLDDLLVYVALGVVVGGRLGYVLFYNFSYYIHAPAEIFAVWRGGMSFHGGLFGAIAAIILFGRARKLPVMPLFDLAGTVAPIGLFFGRIANFINDELWGRPAPDLPWAVIFPTGGPVPRHPSQLYEAFAEGILLFILVICVVRIAGYRRPGLVAGVFGAGYAVARAACEFFREPDPQLGFLFGSDVTALQGGVTMGMVLSLPLLIAGLWLILRALRRPPVPAEPASFPAPAAADVNPAKDQPV